MVKYVALYRKPADVEAFDEAYFASHLPLVERTPGLLRAEVAKVTRVFVPGFLGESELHVVAEMPGEVVSEVLRAAIDLPAADEVVGGDRRDGG